MNRGVEGIVFKDQAEFEAAVRRLKSRPIKILACESGMGFAKKLEAELYQRWDEERDENVGGSGHLVSMAEVKRAHFNDRDMKNIIEDSVSGASVYVVQQIHDYDSGRSPQENFDALKDLVYAARHAVRLPGRITVVMPDYYGARQDKRAMRESIKAAWVAKELDSAGADCVLSMDVHNTAIAGYFEILRCGFENLRSDHVLMEHLWENYHDELTATEELTTYDIGQMSRNIGTINDRITQVLREGTADLADEIGALSLQLTQTNNLLNELTANGYNRGSYRVPKAVSACLDVGGAKRAEYWQKIFDMLLVMGYKERSQTEADVIENMRFLGPIAGKTIFLNDDMIDTNGSAKEACLELKRQGAGNIYQIATHPMFSPPAKKRIGQMYRDGIIQKVITTDTVIHQDNPPWLEVVSAAPMFAEVIYRIEHDMSVSDLMAKKPAFSRDNGH